MKFCPHPSNIDCNWLYNEMGDFLVKNICDIHSRLDIMKEGLPSCDLVSPTSSSESVATMERFCNLQKAMYVIYILALRRKRAYLILSQNLLLGTTWMCYFRS